MVRAGRQVYGTSLPSRRSERSVAVLLPVDISRDCYVSAQGLIEPASGIDFIQIEWYRGLIRLMFMGRIFCAKASPTT